MLFFTVMGHGLPLNDFEKGLITAEKAHGISNRKIVDALGSSSNVVDRYVNGYGTKPHTGRLPLLSDEMKRRIIAEVKKPDNETMSCSDVKASLKLNVSSETIRRVFKKSRFIVRRKMRKAPFITPQNHQNRVLFGRQNQRIDWSKVNFCSAHYLTNFSAFRLCGRTKRNLTATALMAIVFTGTIYAKKR